MHATETTSTTTRRGAHRLANGAACHAWRLAAAALAALSVPVAHAADTTAATTLQVSADGSEVVDLKAGIAWSRCVEGMQWAGRQCSGSARSLDHTQALAAASQRRQAEGKAWRLPRVRELQRLIEHTAAAAQKRLPEPFPGAVHDWHWSASTTVDTSRVNPYAYGNIRQGVTGDNVVRVSFLHGWAVNTATGESAGNVAKRTPLVVRLVRTLEP